MSVPCIVVRIELERAPLVIADFIDESDAVRMDDWLRAHPRTADLIARAQELAEEAKAA